MRSNIEINDTLLRKALKATGLGTKREVVEEGLRLLIYQSEKAGKHSSASREDRL